MDSVNAVFEDSLLGSLEEQNNCQQNLFMLPARMCDLIQSYVFPKVGSIFDSFYIILCTIIYC